MIPRRAHKILLHPLSLYLGFFGLLFLQFPLQNSLPGEVDTWFFVVAFETIGNEIGALFSGTELGNALYPNEAVYPFGNYSPGLAPVYLIFRLLGAAPLWAYYFLITAIFATNAWAARTLALHVHKDQQIALLTGFLFAGCNAAFGALDNPDALAYAPALLAVTWFLKFLERGEWRYMLGTSLAGAAEVYFSSYAFLFGCVALGLIGLAHLRPLFTEKEKRKYFLLLFPLFVLILIPYLNIYVFDSAKSAAWNPGAEVAAVENVALHPVDWLRHLPENLLWPVLDDRVGTHNWLAGTRSAGIGILLWGLGVWGWWKSGRRRTGLGLGFLVFVVLAFGPGFQVGETLVPNLLRPLYTEFDIQNFFRISVRAWLPAVLILALSAGFALKELGRRFRRPAYLIAGIGLFFALENIPIPFHTYDNGKYLYAGVPETQVRGNTDAPLICLHLPASLYSGFHPDLKARCPEAPHLIGTHEVQREYHYMYRQTLHKNHILNGFTGFIPQSRIQVQRYLDRLGEPGKLRELIEKFGIDLFIYHPQYQLDCEPDPTKVLENSTLLRELPVEGIRIFQVKKGGLE